MAMVEGTADLAGEAARLAALHAYAILDTGAEASFDRISRAAADVCGTPMAVISLVDGQRQWFKSTFGIDMTETPRDVSFCTHTIQQDGLLVVRDATADPRFRANPFVTAPDGVRFYAGAPLRDPDGHRLGTLCVFAGTARPRGLTRVQTRMLETLAAQVVAELELRRAMARLDWSAHHDTLTGLPNRRLFRQRLDAALTAPPQPNAVLNAPPGLDTAPIAPQRPDAALTTPQGLNAAPAHRSGRVGPQRAGGRGRLRVGAGGGRARAHRVGVALLDLDNFKQVNDIYGHDAGDTLLRHVATILGDFVRAGETAARLGGDEFVLALPDCGSDAAFARRIDGLMERLRQPYWFDDHRIAVSASIGMACSPGQGVDASTLLAHADIAMYRAKAAGRGLAWRYRHDLGVDVARRADTGNAVRAAIQSGDVFPYYQPQFSLATGRLVGCEALVRYRDRSGRIHLPRAIEEVFEDRELGVGIGQCMIAAVVRDMRRWLDAGIDFGHVAINASAVELRREDYAGKLLQTLADAGLAPSRLHLEVTESVFVGRGSERIENNLRALNAGGVAIALDDFGTGFASLSHLKNFPVDIIKIDRGFIATLEENQVDVTIVTAVIKLAANLGMAIIAEGVETPRQADILQSIGCDVVQGFHFARPMTADKLATLCRTVTARQRTGETSPTATRGHIADSNEPSRRTRAVPELLAVAVGERLQAGDAARATQGTAPRTAITPIT